MLSIGHNRQNRNNCRISNKTRSVKGKQIT